MSTAAIEFWIRFRDIASQLTGDRAPEAVEEELLEELHKVDDRLFFLMSTNARPRELIISADGNKDAFDSAHALVADAPALDGWTFLALKPPMGFDFTHADGPIQLDVAKLWFKPLRSRAMPSQLGVLLAVPDADFVLEHQSVDTAYTILESAIGERVCSTEIAHLEVGDVPDDPERDGFISLPQLPEYIAFHKRRVNGHN